MQRQPWCSFELAGVSLTDFGLQVPSPFTSLEISNGQIASMTSWDLNVIVVGDDSKKSNIAAFEALLYSAAQEAGRYANSSGTPVAFAFGWLREDGSIEDYVSYQGFTLKFKTSTSGQYIQYTVSGYAQLAIQTSMPVLRIPALSGYVQPSAIVEAIARATRATDYYQLDIDRNDAPTFIEHGELTTSFNQYIRGSYDGKDDFKAFPGLLSLSKSYSGSRDGAGLVSGVSSLRQILDNVPSSRVSQFLCPSMSDTAPQCASFSYWVDEPTMTRPGIIHYKNNAGLLTNHAADTLEFGTANTNILSLSGSYSGISYNMTDMRFTQVGFAVDASGNSLIQDAEVVNSWSSSLAEVFQTANIINDVNAIASQFSGDFTVQIPGSVTTYSIAQPVSLIVMAGNTLSPVSGIYNIMSVTHTISNTFVTTLKLKRLMMSSANKVAAGQSIFVSGSSNYPRSSYETTANVLSPYKVDFGYLYPDFTYMPTR